MNKAVHEGELPLATPADAPADLSFRKPSPPPLVQAVDPDEFDWNNVDSIVLREQRATAVYRNQVGEVVIRQKGPWPDEDSFLYISPENEVAFMEGVAEHLRK
jgi:hypothetical protein